jgi:hypothetical protein
MEYEDDAAYPPEAVVGGMIVHTERDDRISRNALCLVTKKFFLTRELREFPDSGFASVRCHPCSSMDGHRTAIDHKTIDADSALATGLIDSDQHARLSVESIVGPPGKGF